MKRYGNLYPEITSFDNLHAAAKTAIKGKKDRARVSQFYFNMETELLCLQEELLNRTYAPRPLRRFQIREPKLREIAASDIRDRVVHHALCRIIEPLLEKSYIYHSYACRTGKGTHRAIKQAQTYSRKNKYFLKCDIRKFFETIDQSILKAMFSTKFKDPDLLWLLHTIIDSPQSDIPGKGIPIGNLTSQHFANFYLNSLDHYVKDTLRVRYYLRYMDDFILFADEKEELHLLHSFINDFLRTELKLELKATATVIAPVSQGLSFLGCRIFPHLLRIKQENKRRALKKLKLRHNEFLEGLISEETYTRSIMSITEHLKIGNTYHLRKDIFNRMYFQG
ncbi:RNA-directed DNA polymerase [Methanolobus psychrotolerans]|uniref:RNA-directed DNA polymerase n=1 Tax=Methanolobus psychrotolerans TaxID=1874706 RepID=UPI000B9197B5|nr:RNA-directed DNA polymerase [Methanolobus psychrotolerans]